ncbi:amino acid:proton symporter [Clostridium novyi B str. ATCC 27606]|uniref:Amino acid:proton symporter n=1 Tax=Clostridium novyi B str. ATCC 27606 TaxID=1443123 RepID=A0AA40IVG4_CLONO|nr:MULTISPECIES: dicarboxylate/amino acid:cation symporter [Clostridium]KEI13838.1 amino acid:proton symporter [Clostridium novyi B str. NCTC 9691]KEI18120.1 amino acid:proton symporter [Clostridium novyi B str. ATCC 27606]OOB75820.1 amino acid:proton symporter [Clostridium haemolyticum]
MQTKLKKIFCNLGVWIIISMILGIIVGSLLGQKASIFAPLGDVFMQLIKMVVIPLVATSIISGAASIGNSKSAGKMGLATFTYYLGSTAIAVTLGLLFGEIFRPGMGIDKAAVTSMFSLQYANKGGMPGFWETIKGIIPINPFESLVQGNILAILFFSLFFGFGIASLKDNRKDTVISFFSGVTEALVYVITKVMYVAPIGVFALMADATGSFGNKVLFLVAKLLIIFILALLVHTFGVYGGCIKLFSKTSPIKFFKKIYGAQLLALSTASSMATLPVSMEICEKELGVAKETTSFVLPLGATINMNGNAIYYALASCFFAQMFGIDLGLHQYIAIIFTSTIGSIGQAGVPGPSLLVVAVLISAGIPVEGLPILIAVDRIFDMLRTTVNITGDASCAVIVDGIGKSK